MDFARRMVRGMIGFDSRLYRAGAVAADFLSTVSREGVASYRTLKRLSDPAQVGKPTESLKLKRLAQPITMRPGTADAGTVINNVIREEYGQFRPATEPKWMIDAGAFIGDTSAYFLSKYPTLRTVAFEPNPSNYEISKQNLERYGDRAVLEKLGIYSEEKVLHLAGEGLLATIADEGVEIRCTTMPAILKRYSIPHVDILKMDIEGAEEAIFKANPEEWLGSVGMLIIEIHGEHVFSLISEVMKKNHFSMRQHRSIWYCTRTAQ